VKVMPEKREFVEVKWDVGRNRIVCKLPLTQPTGRVRVKRRGQPIAVRQEPISAEDVLEWQIAYHDDKGNPAELGIMLHLAYKHALLTSSDLDQLHDFVQAQSEFCDEKFAVVDKPTQEKFAGFEVWWRQHPVLRYEVRGEATVEIEIRHRQRAVGFQSMVFLLVPIRHCEPSNLIGRTVSPKEVAEWSPSAEVLKILVRAFAIASCRHRDDMLDLLRQLTEMGSNSPEGEE